MDAARATASRQVPSQRSVTAMSVTAEKFKHPGSLYLLDRLRMKWQKIGCGSIILARYPSCPPQRRIKVVTQQTSTAFFCRPEMELRKDESCLVKGISLKDNTDVTLAVRFRELKTAIALKCEFQMCQLEFSDIVLAGYVR